MAADKKGGESLKSKSRKEVLEFIKQSPEKFSEEFPAFYELETQLVEISKSLVKYFKVDKDDLLLAHINHINLHAYKALKKAVYSLSDYCSGISFTSYILGTGISRVYELIDFDHEVPDESNGALRQLMSVGLNMDNHLFTRDLGILLGARNALDKVAEAILSLLESQRLERPNRDLAWQHLTEAHKNIGAIEVSAEIKRIDIGEEIKNAISESKRKAALARIERDPKEVAMQKIEAEHEALKPHQKTKGYLAPFAREMQEKYQILQSTAAIERRIRKLRKSKQTK